jgi:hypothetical protein
MCVYCGSADAKRSGCREEEMGHRCCGASGDVREIGVLGEERGSLNGLLEHSSSRVRKEGARLGGASGIRSVNRKVSDDVACDLVTLIQYLLAILILMCGSMAQSNRQSFC